MDLQLQISAVKKRLASAALKSGRKVGEIKILYATKYASAQQIAQLAAIEPRAAIGENRVQDAEKKFEELAQLIGPEKFRAMEKHFIGNLQSNKVRPAVKLFDCIQSVDSVGLAGKISRCAAGQGKTMCIYLEVNNGELRKQGASFEGLEALVLGARTLPSVRLVGLMGMGVDGDPDSTRAFFRKLRNAAGKYGLKTSMGMSGDFEAAIEEGSDMVRLGRAVFAGPDGK